MRQACVTAIEQAIGRSITKAEARNVEARIRNAMVMVARRDGAAYEALPKADKMRAAATYAANELVAEAQKKAQRLRLQIAAQDAVERYTAEQVRLGADPNRLEAFERLLAGKADGKNNSTSVEVEAKGIAAGAMGKLADAWDAISPRMFGIFANKGGEEEFVRAAYGDTAGVRPEIVRAAQEWSKTAETLRIRFNAAGGDVGRLDNWGLPQAWSQDIAVQLGRDEFVNDMMNWVDRSIYRKDDGSLFNDAEMRTFLQEAWLTISTNGANKQKNVTGYGAAIKANRNNKARQLHFKDGAVAVEALRKYSGRSVFEAMAGHVQRMARDVALVEKFGPNADLAVEYFIQTFADEARVANVGQPGYKADLIDRRAASAANLYNYVAGNNPPPANLRVAQAFSALRSIFVAAKLGSATVTSISDEGTLVLTSRVNNLPMFKVWRNELRAFNLADQAEKQRARRAGLLVNTMLDEVNRFGDETLGSQVPAKIASTVMRASGLNSVTEARRRAFSVTMMDTIGQLTRQYQRVDALDPQDWKILRSKGITQEIWDIWRQAQPDTWSGNDTVLTPESIYLVQGVDDLAKEKAATKLLAVIIDERDIAVIEPGARERAALLGGTIPGTATGELARAFWQFKTFPFAIINRHWRRGLGMYSNTSGKVGYIASLVALQTIMGAIAMEASDILSGKDPRTLNPESAYGPRNLIAALLKGGALGLYGDFLFADATTFGRTLAGAIGGPMLGAIEDTFKLTVGNVQELAKGEETNFGAEAVKAARGYTPGASLWYTKTVTDRLIFNQMQEYFDPGYLARARAKARREYGTTYWWNPGQPISRARAPELEAIVEE